MTPSDSVLMDELKKNNKLLRTLVHRVKKTEKGLKDVQMQLKNNSSSESTPGSTPKRPRNKDVPDEVRVSRFFSPFVGRTVCVGRTAMWFSVPP